MYQLVQKHNLTTQLQLQLISTPYHSDIVYTFQDFRLYIPKGYWDTETVFEFWRGGIVITTSFAFLTLFRYFSIFQEKKVLIMIMLNWYLSTKWNQILFSHIIAVGWIRTKPSMATSPLTNFFAQSLFLSPWSLFR